jgi:hypothetical protein
MESRRYGRGVDAFYRLGEEGRWPIGREGSGRWWVFNMDVTELKRRGRGVDGAPIDEGNWGGGVIISSSWRWRVTWGLGVMVATGVGGGGTTWPRNGMTPGCARMGHELGRRRMEKKENKMGSMEDWPKWELGSRIHFPILFKILSWKSSDLNIFKPNLN